MAHLGSELPLEFREFTVVRRGQGLLHEFGRGREVREPNVVVIAPREIRFGDTAVEVSERCLQIRRPSFG